MIRHHEPPKKGVHLSHRSDKPSLHRSERQVAKQPAQKRMGGLILHLRIYKT